MNRKLLQISGIIMLMGLIVLTLSSCDSRPMESKPHERKGPPEDSGSKLSISSIIPNHTFVGDTVAITGHNFNPTASKNTVKFGRKQARIIAATPTKLKVIVPKYFEKMVTVAGAGPAQDPFKVYKITTKKDQEHVLISVSTGNKTVTASSEVFTLIPHYSPENFVTHQHNLNVVYFVPNNNPPITNYKVRISNLLIYIQDYYKSEMKRNGFGSKTFGLSRKANGKGVKIITIEGKYGFKKYNYSVDAANQILDEISGYRQIHPEDFTSVHTLIILPKNPGELDLPFFGYGNNAFVVDNLNIRVTKVHPTKSNLTGGMVHELGHGLNLPHNTATVSQKTNLGTALMGVGNSTFGQSPTFITKAMGAILNRNQIFQKGSTPDIYESTQTTLTVNMSFNSNTKELRVYGSFTSNKPVSDVLIWVDPGGGGPQAVSWVVNKNGSNYDAILPLKQIPNYGANRKYTLTIKLLMKNGSINEYDYSFKLDNGKFKLPSKVSVYQHSNNNGWSIELKVDSYTTSELVALGGVDNDISSIKVPFGLKVTLYAKDNFTGESYEMGTGSEWFLSGFNDVTSSIVISEQ